MIKKVYDVVVVGAGPAGSEASFQLIKKGFKVAVIEKQRLDREKPCGGAIQLGEIVEFGMPPKEVVEREIKRANIYGPNGAKISLATEKEGISAITVQRSKYDKFLQERARGAHFFELTEIKDIKKNKEGFEILVKKEDVESSLFANVLLHAAGANARELENLLGIAPQPPEEKGITIQFWMKISLSELDRFFKDLVEFYYYPRDIGEGYFWIFPRGKILVTGLGVAYKSIKEKGLHLKKLLHGFIEERFLKLGIKNYQKIREEAGEVPLKLRERVAYSGLLLLGDAAGVANSIHGGGIYQARKSAVIAAEVVEEYFKNQENIENYEERLRDHFETYEKKWDRKLKPFFLKEKLLLNLIDYAKEDNSAIKEAFSIILGSHLSHERAYKILESQMFSLVTERLDELIKDYKADVENGLKQLFKDNSQLSIMAREILLRKGRRLRAVLVLLSGEVLGASREELLPVALAYELSHTASLVHDDIIDDGYLRRGGEALHKKYGIGNAISVGDALLIKAFEMLSAYKLNNKVSKRILINLIKTGCEGGLRASHGEIMDVNFSLLLLPKIGIKYYIDLVKAKTGALIEAATKAGAVLANALPEEVKAFSLYGKNLGVAFQIYDDAKDLLAPQEVSLKTQYNDIMKAKLTPQLIYTFKKANSEERKRIINILSNGRPSRKEVDEILALYQRYNAIMFSQKLARIFLARARNAIKDIKENKAKQILIGILDVLGYWTEFGG